MAERAKQAKVGAAIAYRFLHDRYGSMPISCSTAVSR
jgi:hypothetical protein